MQMEWSNELKTLREKWVSKYGVFSGSYISIFSPNTGKYGPEKTSTLFMQWKRCSIDYWHIICTKDRKQPQLVGIT